MSTTLHHPARRAALLTVGMLLASGCAGGLLPRPAAPPLRYTLGETPLEAPNRAAPGSAPTSPPRPSLVVAAPTAAPGFESTRMVYLLQPQVLQAYAYAEWAEPPARLLAPLLVRALQQTGAFLAVLQAPSAASGGLRLETELLRLQHEHTQRPSALRLTLRAVLIDTGTRQALATRVFDTRWPATIDNPAGGAAAAAAATQALLAELAAYVAGYVTADVAAAAAAPAVPGAEGAARREP